MIRVLLALIILISPVSAQDSDPTTAQPPLPTVVLKASNGKTLTAEVADENDERTAGLMFREKLAPDSGMLFVLPRPQRASFWMRNTLIPLSIAYINASGLILEIHDLKPHDETTVKSTFPSIAYALEMEQGWFNTAGIMPGDRLSGLPKITGQ